VRVHKSELDGVNRVLSITYREPEDLDADLRT
jgi:hypothetical protein